MSTHKPYKRPWMVAVWPGMGQVALSAGYYLLSKLSMHQIAEFSPEGLFDIEHVDVQQGLVQPLRRPRSRLFAWRAPQEVEHDLVVFLGEAQPPQGKYPFCESLVGLAKELGVERIFTFAAMGTQMHPQQPSRVFAVCTHSECLQVLPSERVEILEEGQISGLNGVLLGAALANDLPGICLLGEMPHIFSQLPYPKASLAVLNVFTDLANLQLDITELKDQAATVDRKLSDWLATIQKTLQQDQSTEGDKFEEGLLSEEFTPPPPAGMSQEEQRQIEELFELASRDRSKAYELKRLLDQLDVFDTYEDRFLDLFKAT